jgi:hypothetical protein
VLVSRSSKEVEWLHNETAGKNFIFSLPEYDLAIEAGASDVSWEKLGKSGTNRRAPSFED